LAGITLGFSATQQATEKYEHAPNVVFCFIDTWKRVPNPQENTVKFIADNSKRAAKK
jgi:hypothetical protein